MTEKWADYLISAVRYNREETHIDEVPSGHCESFAVLSSCRLLVHAIRQPHSHSCAYIGKASAGEQHARDAIADDLTRPRIPIAQSLEVPYWNPKTLSTTNAPGVE